MITPSLHFPAPFLHFTFSQSPPLQHDSAFPTVVGYQKTPAAHQNYNFLCNTFQNTSGGDLTLGDLVPADVEIEGMSESMVQFFNANGGVAKKDFGGTIGVQNETYVYMVDDPVEPWIPGGTGWYLAEGDDDHEYPQNDRVIAMGEAFVLNCAQLEVGMTINFNGQVKKTATTLTAAKDYNFWGYCSPKSDGTLGDIALNGEIEGMTESMLQFFNANGGVAKKDFGGTIGIQNETYVYMVDDPVEPWIPGGTGWYLAEGDDDHEYPQNNRQFSTGEGFIYNCAQIEVGMQVQIPSAL